MLAATARAVLACGHLPDNLGDSWVYPRVRFRRAELLKAALAVASGTLEARERNAVRRTIAVLAPHGDADSIAPLRELLGARGVGASVNSA